MTTADQFNSFFNMMCVTMPDAKAQLDVAKKMKRSLFGAAKAAANDKIKELEDEIKEQA